LQPVAATATIKTSASKSFNNVFAISEIDGASAAKATLASIDDVIATAGIDGAVVIDADAYGVSANANANANASASDVVVASAGINR
jgi:hypothetical protein